MRRETIQGIQPGRRPDEPRRGSGGTIVAALLAGAPELGMRIGDGDSAVTLIRADWVRLKPASARMTAISAINVVFVATATDHLCVRVSPVTRINSIWRFGGDPEGKPFMRLKTSAPVQHNSPETRCRKR